MGSLGCIYSPNHTHSSWWQIVVSRYTQTVHPYKINVQTATFICNNYINGQMCIKCSIGWQIQCFTDGPPMRPKWSAVPNTDLTSKVYNLVIWSFIPMNNLPLASGRSEAELRRFALETGMYNIDMPNMQIPCSWLYMHCRWSDYNHGHSACATKIQPQNLPSSSRSYLVWRTVQAQCRMVRSLQMNTLVYTRVWS